MRHLLCVAVLVMLLQVSAVPQQQGKPAPEVPPGTMGPDGAYALGDGVTPPTPLTRIAPEVSDLAKRLFAQGDVLLSVVVKSDATLQDIRVVRSVGYGMDESAINTLRKWRFRPGSKDGMPVDVRIKVELAYRLAPDAKRWRWGAGPMIFDSEQGVTPPRIRGGNMPRPVHEAANETVLLQFAVGTDGNVSSVQALQSEKGEDSASLPILVKAVSEWMFTPASNGTEPVPAHGKVLLIKGGDQFRYEVSTAFIASGKVQTPAAKPTANPGRIQVIEVPVEVRLEPDEAQKRLSTYVPAEYPAAAKAAGIHGSVLLAVKIAKDGTVRDVQPLSGPSELVAPAVEAVKKWHYAPAEFRGRPCQATTEVEIQFKLPE